MTKVYHKMSPLITLVDHVFTRPRSGIGAASTTVGPTKLRCSVPPSVVPASPGSSSSHTITLIYIISSVSDDFLNHTNLVVSLPHALGLFDALDHPHSV